MDVRIGADGFPARIREHGQWLDVASVEDTWRVVDEWWREQPVMRTYYEVVLKDGRRLTCFLDELAGTWHRIRA